ncbi:MAG TPA: N-6 DNA methylase, partial [Thermoleophilia bacterium]|nr:N-6 DNA methylase [Thermoleophilia bacterium]
RGAERPGRAAVVVPNGTLSGDGICARIKEQLLTEFDLHTVVRLPNGVFSPYTDIPTNLLFFERGNPTDEIWYYELPLPEGRKNYTKTKPLTYEEFADLIAWWPRGIREENEHAWRVKASDVIKRGEDGTGPVSVNLDIKNPNAAEALEHLPPGQLIDDMLTKENELVRLTSVLKDELAVGAVSGEWPTFTLGEILMPTTRMQAVEPESEYRLLGVRLDGAGPFLREKRFGAELSASSSRRSIQANSDSMAAGYPTSFRRIDPLGTR